MTPEPTTAAAPESWTLPSAGRAGMPAYAKQLRPAEVTALVAFLETLRPENQPPARDSMVPATPAPNPG